MYTRAGGAVAPFVLAVGLALAPAGARAGEHRSNGPFIRIGVAASLLRGIPPNVLVGLMEPFAVLVKAQTGMAGELVPVLTADELARMLDDSLRRCRHKGRPGDWLLRQDRVRTKGSAGES